ncbi:hypothetical protein EVAR_87132_1 [Eumeta japonica]|uniref:Uncharacterized protein n=1 Tax=Eumeta variegata TaxID=151549 RepID=A0A4C1VUZ4_EUMVA|nr:hypothetical protein EVAR_87132_1 [Eumeta japonica]
MPAPYGTNPLPSTSSHRGNVKFHAGSSSVFRMYGNDNRFIDSSIDRPTLTRIIESQYSGQGGDPALGLICCEPGLSPTRQCCSAMGTFGRDQTRGDIFVT